MSDRAISVRDLAFVRDVLIPRCAWLQGPEVEELVRLRLRIDAVITAITAAEPTPGAEPSASSQEEPCS